ncbi:phosphonoacetaldehyde reductase [Maridesulfovibrio sp.]|uniref:phosphonoacetaldehyde reductase n=1 Tax=Maridesulfovibrio sp. TaxID=2795000 RepID=UPI0029F52B28|nr:phosphonoacetaldehyde reductase [Maridesulfovibrio sp.]
MSVYIGSGSLKELLDEIRSRNYPTILVATGRTSFEKSGLKQLLLSRLSGSKLIFFSDFSPNVKSAESYAGILKCKASGASAILAIGGGSVIDMAKTISLAPQSEQELELLILGQQKVKETLPLFCAPTTAGSGSEATHFAVIYMNGKKYSLADLQLLPESVAIDPQLSSSMPPYLTACSGFDALSQAIESYWAQGATVQSREYAAKAINLILPSLEKAVTEPSLEIRERMALGAHYAGKAINLSKTTAPHALSYYLTSKYGIPHGHAVAIFTGLFFKINQTAIPEQLYDLMGCHSAESCFNFWYKRMSRCGLEPDLRELNIPESECKKIVDSVNLERLKNNPVNSGKDYLLQQLVEFYRSLSEQF